MRIRNPAYEYLVEEAEGDLNAVAGAGLDPAHQDGVRAGTEHKHAESDLGREHGK
jgi:hypothetical protein